MQTNQPGFGHRITTAFKRILLTLFVFGLLALVAYLASERNAHTYALEQVNGQLVVKKGRMFPWGTQPWSPPDAALAAAYAPIPLEGTDVDPALLQQHFSDRDELDRALFGVLDQLARPRVASENPKEVQRGLDYVRRMKLLSGLTQDQRASLEKLQSDFALFVARSKLNEARQLVAEALEQLQLASRSTGPNALRANQMSAEVTGPAKQLEDALSRAVAGVPPPQPTPPQPPPPQEPVQQPMQAQPLQSADAGS